MNYTEIPNFADVLLEESWVLKIAETEDSLRFEMELVLTSNNPRFVPPGPDELYCTAMGDIEFWAITDRLWVKRTNLFSRDATGEIDFGNIDSLTFEGDTYVMFGDGGELRVQTPLPPTLTYR